MVFSAFLSNLSFLAAEPSRDSSGFRVEGEAVNWYPHHPSLGTNRWSFEVSVLRGQWHITTRRQDGIRFAYGSDNRDVYSLVVPATGAARKTCGNVFSGIYPIQSPGVSIALSWLAYCSSSYFSQGVAHITNGAYRLPCPWRSPAADPLANIYRAKVTFGDGPPGLPRRVAYIPDRGIMKDVLDGALPSYVRVKKDVWDQAAIRIDGYQAHIDHPEAVYVVEESTNIHGLLLPASFSLSRYHLRPYGSAPTTKATAGPKLFSFTKGRLHSAEPIRDLDWLPQTDDPGHVAHIADYRFVNFENNIGFVTYDIRENRWITNRNDPYLQSLVAAETALKSRWFRRANISPQVISFLFVVVVGAPLLSKSVRRCIGRVILK